MSDKNNGGAAFPQSGYERWAPECGMSLRDYFAAKAMQGMTSAFDGMPLDSIADSIPRVASISYTMADFMLAERAK